MVMTSMGGNRMRTIFVLAAVLTLTLGTACSDDAERAGSGGATNGGGHDSVGGQSASGGKAAAAGGGNAAAGAAGSAASGGAGAECPTESPAKTPSVCSTAQQGKLCKYADSCFYCGCMPQQAGMYCAYGSGDCPQ